MIKNNANNQLEAIMENILHDEQNAITFISQMHCADIADLIDNATTEVSAIITKILFEKLPQQIAPVLGELSPTLKAQIINQSKDLSAVFASTDVHEIISIVKDLEENSKEYFLNFAPAKLKVQVLEQLSYPAHTAGRIMRSEFISCLANDLVGDVLNQIHHQVIKSEFQEIFITNNQLKPIGKVHLSTLIQASPSASIASIMKKYHEYATNYTKQEELSYICRQYNLLSIAIVDEDERMVGVIDAGDIVDILEEEVEEDLRKIAGIIDISDMHAAFIDTIKNRFPWLFVNLIVACLSSLVIVFFEDTVHRIVALAAIMPISPSLGGNAGTQTLTVIVRALAHRELTLKNGWKVILREMFTSMINGVLLAILGGFILTFFFHHSVSLSLVFGCSVIITNALAGFFGSFIPIALSRIGIDPATASVVFLTALTDTLAFFSLFGLAKLFLL